MTYLLILFVVLLALAPLSHFFPSRRQREIVHLREYAATQGMFVEYRDLPSRDSSAPVPVGSPSRTAVYYGLRLGARAGRGEAVGRWIRGARGWQSLGRRQPIPAEISALPADILAASVDASSCGVYWRETAGEAVVARIYQALLAWQKELRS